MLVSEFVAKNKTASMPQPPYSPDLGPADYFPLSKTEERKRFATIGDIKEKSKQKLLAILKSAFQKCFQNLKKKSWLKCIISEGGRLLWTNK